MVAPLIDPTAPGWARMFALRLNAAFKNASPTGPERLASFTFAQLPPAADWIGCQVYVSDKHKVGLSNGSTWTDPAGGAL